MTFATELQSFQGSNTYQDSTSSNCIPIWTDGICYITGGQGGWTTMAKVNIVGGDEADYQDLSGLADPVLNVDVGTGYPWGVDSDGQLYFRSGLGMSRLDPGTWTRNDTWGDVSFPIFPPPLPTSTGSSDALGGQIVVTKNDDNEKFWLSGGVGGFGSHGNDVFLQSGDEFAGLFFTGYDPGNTTGCNGPAGSGLLYYTTHSSSTSDPALIFKILCESGSWIPADWPTPNSSITKSTLASVDPTDIDAAWGNIQIGGVCLDLSDDNILAVFIGDAGSNRRYLTKVDASSGAILWSTAISNSITPGAHMRFSRVRGRMYFVIDGHIYGYDTSDGSLIIDQTSGLSGLSVIGSQMFDDETGVIIGLLTQATPGVDSPTILNTTPAFTAGSVAWMALYVTTPSVALDLPADTGAFSFSGGEAFFGRSLVASRGTFVLTGEAAAFGGDGGIVADTGHFTLTGQDADFRLNDDYGLVADPGFFNVIGFNATFCKNRSWTDEACTDSPWAPVRRSNPN